MGRNYIKEKRNKVDRCNICGRVQTLTWDHVPPKSEIIAAHIQELMEFKAQLEGKEKIIDAGECMQCAVVISAWMKG